MECKEKYKEECKKTYKEEYKKAYKEAYKEECNTLEERVNSDYKSTPYIKSDRLPKTIVFLIYSVIIML